MWYVFFVLLFFPSHRLVLLYVFSMFPILFICFPCSSSYLCHAYYKIAIKKGWIPTDLRLLRIYYESFKRATWMIELFCFERDVTLEELVYVFMFSILSSSQEKTRKVYWTNISHQILLERIRRKDESEDFYMSKHSGVSAKSPHTTNFDVNSVYVLRGSI